MSKVLIPYNNISDDFTLIIYYYTDYDLFKRSRQHVRCRKGSKPRTGSNS